MCSKHGVHIISDEIYAMSVFDGTQFNSVLSFTKEEVIKSVLVKHHFISIWESFFVKRIVIVILSDPPCKDGNTRFTTVP